MEQRPSYSQIWNISFPIILSLLAQNIIGLTDTAFLSQVGETELGASTVGSVYYFVLFMLGFGFTTGTQILIARRNGEKNYKAIGPLMENSWYLLIVGAVAIVALSPFVSPLVFKSMDGSPSVLEAAINFTNIRIFGLPFAFIMASFRAFHVGTTNSKVLTFSGIVMAIINIFLDYALIFGKFGFPEMGLQGAAIASVIAEFSAATFLILYNLNKKNRLKYQLFCFRKVDVKLIKEMFSISIYIMILYFISNSTWLIFFLIIGGMGERSLAISGIIRSLYGLFMLPIWGYTSTTSSLVSNVIGAGRTDFVIPTIKRMCKIGFITSGVLSIILVTFGQLLLSLFSKDDITLVTEALPSLYVIAMANIIFGMSSIIFNGIAGTGKTKIAMFIELSTLVLYINYAFLMVRLFSHQVAFAWTSEIVYWTVLGLFSIWYLRTGKWQGVKI